MTTTTTTTTAKTTAKPAKPAPSPMQVRLEAFGIVAAFKTFKTLGPEDLTPAQLASLQRAGIDYTVSAKTGRVGFKSTRFGVKPSDAIAVLGWQVQADRSVEYGTPIVGVYVDGKPLMRGQLSQYTRRDSITVTTK